MRSERFDRSVQTDKQNKQILVLSSNSSPCYLVMVTVLSFQLLLQPFTWLGVLCDGSKRCGASTEGVLHK